MVLPGAVRVSRAEHLLGTFQLFGALDKSDRRPGDRAKAIPVGLGLRDLVLGELVGLVHHARIDNTERTVPVVRHAVVTESIDVIDLEPVMVHREKIVARKLPIEVRALAEVAEVILGEWPHEWVLAILQPCVYIEIWKVDSRMAIHCIYNDRDPLLMGNVDHRLEIRSLSEPFVHAEVADWEISPVH